MEQSARDHAVSWPIVNAAGHVHAAHVLPATDSRIEAMDIDEIRRGKPRWRRNELPGA